MRRDRFRKLSAELFWHSKLVPEPSTNSVGLRHGSASQTGSGRNISRPHHVTVRYGHITKTSRHWAIMQPNQCLWGDEWFRYNHKSESRQGKRRNPGDTPAGVEMGTCQPLPSELLSPPPVCLDFLTSSHWGVWWVFFFNNSTSISNSFSYTSLHWNSWRGWLWLFPAALRGRVVIWFLWWGGSVSPLRLLGTLLLYWHCSPPKPPFLSWIQTCLLQLGSLLGSMRKRVRMKQTHQSWHHWAIQANCRLLVKPSFVEAAVRLFCYLQLNVFQTRFRIKSRLFLYVKNDQWNVKLWSPTS